jgi:hypothetical protein
VETEFDTALSDLQARAENEAPGVSEALDLYARIERPAEAWQPVGAAVIRFATDLSQRVPAK